METADISMPPGWIAGAQPAALSGPELACFLKIEEASEIGTESSDSTKGEGNMLYWAAVFFIIAIVAAVFGFMGIAVAAAGIARILFFIFVIVFLITLIAGLARRRSKVL